MCIDTIWYLPYLPTYLWVIELRKLTRKIRFSFSLFVHTIMPLRGSSSHNQLACWYLSSMKTYKVISRFNTKKFETLIDAALVPFSDIFVGSRAGTDIIYPYNI